MDDLGTLFALCLRLLRHRALHCGRQLDVLDLHRGHLHSPTLRMLINDGLQFAVDLVALRQQLIQLRLAQYVAQRRLTDLRRRLEVVHYVHNRVFRVYYVEVHDRCNLYRHIVARDHFLRWNRQCHNTQIDSNHARNEWGHQEYTRPLGPGQTTEHENHTTFILLHYPDRGEEQHQ